MPSRDEIEDGELIDEIEVRILESHEGPTSSLAWRLTVEDRDGNNFDVKVWQTHEVTVSIREGWRYVLHRGRGKRWENRRLTLHSTTDFTVTRPPGVVELLAIGDTHIGRENRPEDTGAPYRTARQFLAAMGYAERYRVDAVVHAGDLFDDVTTVTDRAIAESGFDILAQHDIPFCYVYGNHGASTAESFYRRVSGVELHHLNEDGVTVGNSVALFGVDQGTEENIFAAASDFANTQNMRDRVLVLHNEISPPRLSSGVPISTISDHARMTFDCVLAGHMHNCESAESSGAKIQHLGSTADLSKVNNAVHNSAWLVRVAPDETSLQRIPIR